MYQPGKLENFLPSQPFPSSKPVDETGAILLKAAQLIRERGHTQGNWEFGPRLCLHGSINVAAGGRANLYYGVPFAAVSAHNRIANYLQSSGAGGVNYSAFEFEGVQHTACGWNNACGRTAAEVIAALEAAAFHSQPV